MLCPRRFFIAIFGIFILGLGSRSCQATDESTWKVGLARAVVTPEKPMWMAGYAGRKQPAQGKLHDLWTKVAVMEDARGKRVILVTNDLVIFSKTLYDQLADAIERRYGIGRADLMLNASHTHSGPCIYGFFNFIYSIDEEQRALIKEYALEQLVPTILETIGRAIDDLQPAELFAGEGEAHFAANRRNNPWGPIVDKLRSEGKLKGPTDPTVPVLAVRHPDGSLRAVIGGYACHNVTLCDNYEWAGDWAGFAQIEMEKAHPGVQAMVFQGCGADQNSAPRLGLAATKKYGNQFACAVDTVLEKPMRPLRPTVKTAFAFVSLPYGPPLSREELEAKKDAPGFDGRWARHYLAELDAGKKWDRSYDTFPVQVWRLGDNQLWVALGGEVTVEYALKFKELFGPTCWTAGYTNDTMAYIPSTTVQTTGGTYERGCFRYFGIPAHDWAPGIEDRITAGVKTLVEKVQE